MSQAQVADAIRAVAALDRPFLMAWRQAAAMQQQQRQQQRKQQRKQQQEEDAARAASAATAAGASPKASTALSQQGQTEVAGQEEKAVRHMQVCS